MAAAAFSAERPNIVFILSDDLSYRDLGSYGQEHYETPTLDRLVAEGLRFRRAYAGSPECAPTRASLLTGRHMGHCRIRANNSARGQDHLLDSDRTIAEVLREAGYRTAFCGKWGVGLPGTEGAPHRQGFDLAYGFYDQFRAHTFFPEFLVRNGERIEVPENRGFDMARLRKVHAPGNGNRYDADGRLVADGTPDPRAASYSEDLILRSACDFIREQGGETGAAPFFLYYATQLPHGPCIVPDIGKFLDREGWSQTQREWAAMVEYLDGSVATLVEALEAGGHIEDTLLLFAGDNGYSQWGYFGRRPWEDDPIFHNKGPWPKGKFSVTHEGGVRVPFFAYWRGTIAPGESDHPVAFYDVLATAADLAGVEDPPATDGISFAPTLRGRPEQQETHEYLYWENGTREPHVQTVRLGERWWATREHPDRPIRLYEIERDPACSRDVAGAHPEVVGRVREIFSEAREDSEWFLNPGDSDETVAERTARARAEGSLQVPTPPNGTDLGERWKQRILGETEPPM